MKKIRCLVMSKSDNVATLLEEAKLGDCIDYLDLDMKNQNLFVLENVDQYHKVAIEDIYRNQVIIKYGEVIGKASTIIRKGEWVHVHNLNSIKTTD